MKAVVLLQGGQGNVLMSTQIVRELKNIYEKIYIVSYYDWWGRMLQDECPEKFSAINLQVLPQLAVEVMRSPKDWHWLQNIVYMQNDFMLRKSHFYNELRRVWGLPEGDVLPPYLAAVPDSLPFVSQIANGLGKFVVFCRRGGMPVPINGQQAPAPIKEEVGLLREYPEYLSKKLVAAIKKRGLRVLQCKLDNEPLVEGCDVLPQIVPMPIWHEIIKRAECVVTIDSCLMHVSAADAKKMVVIWRETSPEQFGYKRDNIINLMPKDYKPIAPLMSAVPDTPICEPAGVDEIINAMFETKKNGSNN